MSYKIKLKRPNAKESVLMVEFMKNGYPFKFYTGKTINTKNWSVKKQEVLSGEENFQLINQYLDNWKSELKRIIAEMEANKIRLNKEVIQEQLDIAMKKDIPQKQDEGQVQDFVSFMDNLILNRKATKRAIQKLHQTRKLLIIGFNLITKKHLAEWESLSIKEKSRTNLSADHKLSFEDVNLKFIQKFRDYLLTAQFKITIKGVEVTQNYKINYIGKQIRGLKQFITEAIEAGYVKPFSWKSIKSEDREVDSVHTDFTEIQCMNDANLDIPIEIKVRDKYVVNCFLGFRYSDLNRLEPFMFKKRIIGGQEFVVYCGRLQKTDQLVEFAVHPIAVEKLEKYNYCLPKITASEFNEVIKIVAQKAGLTGLERIREIRGTETIIRELPKCELMSSHAGRRSFCTNFYNEGVSIQAIMSISGHTTEKEFRKYIKKTSIRLEVVAQQVFAIKGLDSTRKVA